MNQLYKSLFIEKISSFVCFIKYRNQSYTFERPFRIGVNAEPLIQSSAINLIDCTTNTLFTMYFDDILMFHTKHENDIPKSNEELSKLIVDNEKIFSQLKFLKGKCLYDLFFRSDFDESRFEKIRNIRILDALQLDELDDYTKLIKNDKSVIEMLKTFWYSKIMERYNSVVKSLNEEFSIATDDIAVELNDIKNIITIIPKDVERELSNRHTRDEILSYWPLLLLPRPDLFDVK